MLLREIEERIASLPKLVPVPTVRAFMERVPMRPTFHFLRPVRDDLVLFASAKNVVNETAAIDHAGKVLDYVEGRIDEIVGRDVTKLEPFSGGPPWADAVACLGPAVAQTIVAKGSFLMPITYDVYPINHVELAGDETQAEATVRKKAVILNDLTRVIDPVVFARYRLANGSKSAKHFAIGKKADVAELIGRAAEVGGHLEFENFERKRGRIQVETAGATLDVTVEGATRKLSLDDTLSLFDTMTTKGAAAVS